MTRMGHKFYESDVPRIADALTRIANAMNEPKVPAEALVVEQVWVLHDLDTRTPVDKFTVYASEARVRAALRDTWQGQDFGLSTTYLAKLDAWDGQRPVIIGPYHIQTATVNL